MINDYREIIFFYEKKDPEKLLSCRIENKPHLFSFDVNNFELKHEDMVFTSSRQKGGQIQLNNSGKMTVFVWKEIFLKKKI